ncbi:MAG: hypothetical protein HKN33_18920 [Pyrinomonadaceae bacterium]|nr:hypothetical protein [Pyrinomonadaceae bacterium]
MRENLHPHASQKRLGALIIGAAVVIFSIIFLVIEAPAQKRKAFRIVKTSIPVGYKASIAASDEIIVFGTGFNTGIEYIRPGDKTSRKIPNGDTYSSKFFAVAGTKIIMARPSDFTIAVFDTATGNLKEIPESTLRLRSIGGSMHMGGSIQSSGNYAVVITDTSGDDNSALKVIDISGDDPKVIRFEGSGPDNNSRLIFRQAAIDSKSGLVAGGGGDYAIWLFDYKNPSKAPASIDLKPYKGLGRAQMRFDGGKILFHTNESYARAGIIDAVTGKITELSRASYGLALRNGTYIYFASRDSKDSHSIVGRAAVGKAGGQPRFATGQRPVGRSKNNGLIGFGASAAVTPDGRIFIGGMEDIGRTERFQTYRAGRYSLYPDRSTNPRFLMATDLVASSKLLAFKVGTNNKTTLGYAQL